MRGILELLSLQRDNPELLRAQLAAFSRQIPLLYTTLLVSTLCLAATHYGHAPLYLTVHVPAVLAAACLWRVVMWWRTSAEHTDEAAAYRKVRSVVVLGFVLGVGFTTWSFALFPYGDADRQGHVVFYMAITVIACIFCLMHVRLAAFTITAVVVVPLAAFLLSSGNPVFISIAINVVLVAIAMIYILLTNYHTFAAMVASRKELLVKQEETQRLSDENMRLANMDSLTDLPNRRQFFARVQPDGTEVVEAFSVGLLDLDGFKPVNDLFGHAVGDKVLIEVGRRLEGFASSSVFVARLGGDEFGILVRGDSSAEALMDLGRAICADLERPFEMPEATAKLSGSIGFAHYRPGGLAPVHVMERADYALYHAKQNQRGTAVIFSEGLESQLLEMNRIEQELRRSDLEKDLSLVFQPMVDVVDDEVLAFEALARWSTPSLGNVPPDIFIPIAERTETINRITATLLAKALEAAKSWPPHVRITFNLSVRDISSKASLLRLVSIIEKSGLPPSRLILEITETALMRDFDMAVEALTLLKRLGLEIALDDFGTGHSSLGYVHRLPLDRIKVDRSFITNIATDDVSRSIVKTIIDLCNNLGVKCIVEGMETSEQVEILRSFGCRRMQGYYFGRPVPLEETHACLRRGAATLRAS